MAKISYTKCDICGDELRTDPRIWGFVNGYNILGLDICDNCKAKIKQLSTDIDIEEKCWKLILKDNRKYSNDDVQAAYYQGVEDCLANLSHNRLRNIKNKTRN